MSTVIGFTTLELGREKKQALMRAASEAIATVYERHALYLHEIPQEDCSPQTKNHTRFVVMVPPSITPLQRRTLCAALNDAMVHTVGCQGVGHNQVVFKYHGAEALGIDGEYLLDRTQSKG